MTTPKKKKILPKTNTGDIIEGFGFAGGPRGVSRSAKIKEVMKKYRIKPKKSLQNQKSWKEDTKHLELPGQGPGVDPSKVKLSDIKISTWTGKGPITENPLPSSYYRKIANIKNRKQDTINKLKVKKKKKKLMIPTS